MTSIWWNSKGRSMRLRRRVEGHKKGEDGMGEKVGKRR